MFVHSLRVRLHLPSHSLKGKRGIVKSLLARARQQFNVSAAEVDLQDSHGTAVLGFAVVTGGRAAGADILARLEEWIAEERPDVEVAEMELEER
ncbi:MAG TPA: DUF503 domain-containing protein [Verrucomicrobiae bacterium]|nr:DUF503 domain-containing protein [Verrucomicrobiae bacterium]